MTTLAVVGLGCGSADGDEEAAGSGTTGVQEGDSSGSIAQGTGREDSTGPSADSSGGETGGGETTAGPAESSGGDSSTGVPGDTGDTGEMAEMRTLIVADENAGIGLWLDAGALEDNVGPDAVLGGVTGMPLALMRHDERLIVATDDPNASLVFFDDLHSLADGDEPDDVLTAAAIGGPIEPIWFDEPEIWVEANGDLWIGRYEYFQRLVGAAADGSSFDGSVSFGHPWWQLVSATVVADTDVLFGAQISGAGVVAWNGALTSDSVLEEPSFTVLDGVMPDAVHQHGDRLLVGGGSLMIWHDASAIAGPSEPDVTLGPDNGIDSRVAHVHVAGDALYASMPAGGRVVVFTGLDSLDETSVPDLVLGDALEPARAMLDDAGDLWVLDRNGVLRYRDVHADGSLTIKLNESAVDATDALVVAP